MTVYNVLGERMSDDPRVAPPSAARANIADRIHEAVSSLLDTEARLNAEVKEAREIAREQKHEIEDLRGQLAAEQSARRHLEEIISGVAKLVQPHND